MCCPGAKMSPLGEGTFSTSEAIIAVLGYAFVGSEHKYTTLLYEQVNVMIPNTTFTSIVTNTLISLKLCSQ